MSNRPPHISGSPNHYVASDGTLSEPQLPQAIRPGPIPIQWPWNPAAVAPSNRLGKMKWRHSVENDAILTGTAGRYILTLSRRVHIAAAR